MALPDKQLESPIDDITLKSIDSSIVHWFNVEFPVTIGGRKVPVLYATAERWARAQKEKGFRDESGILILPIISIRRTIPDPMKERYTPDSDETNLTIMKRISTNPLSNNDKQSAIQNNRIPDPDYVNTKDETVYEIVQVPFPSFVNLDYDVTIWTSYMSHQNLNQENIFKEFRAGRQWFKVDNYYFFGVMRGATDQSNLDDFSEKEKVIRYNFKLMIQAYFIDKNKIKTFRTSGNTKVRISETSIPTK